MAAALELLKERGDLKAPLQWAGRTNDINEAQRLRNEGQLTDVYTGEAARAPLAQQGTACCNTVQQAASGELSDRHIQHDNSDDDSNVRRLVSMQAGARTITMQQLLSAL